MIRLKERPSFLTFRPSLSVFLIAAFPSRLSRSLSPQMSGVVARNPFGNFSLRSFAKERLAPALSWSSVIRLSLMP